MTTTLKDLRTKQGLTQEALAKKTGIALRTYRNYETGRRKPKYQTTKAFAEALGTTMDQLF